MPKLDKNKVSLAAGCFLALVHAVWALLILLIPSQLQAFLNLIFDMHMIEPLFKLTAFNPVSSLMLVLMTFVFGYVAGFVFSAIYNRIIKK